MKIELLIVSLLFLASFHLYSHKSVDDKFTAYKSEWSKNYDNLELE